MKNTFISDDEFASAVGALTASGGPGKVWLIQPAAGVQQSLPIWPRSGEEHVHQRRRVARPSGRWPRRADPARSDWSSRPRGPTVVADLAGGGGEEHVHQPQWRRGTSDHIVILVSAPQSGTIVLLRGRRRPDVSRGGERQTHQHCPRGRVGCDRRGDSCGRVPFLCLNVPGCLESGVGELLRSSWTWSRLWRGIWIRGDLWTSI